MKTDFVFGVDERFTLPTYARQALADANMAPQRDNGELNAVMKRLLSEGNPLQETDFRDAK